MRLVLAAPACVLVAAVVSAQGIATEELERQQAELRLFPTLETLADGHALRDTFDAALAGDPTSADELIGLLGHENSRVAHWAGRTLARFPTASVLLVLAERFENDDRPFVRVGVLLGLFRGGDPSVAQRAVTALSDSSGIVQIAGQAIIRETGDPDLSLALLAYLDSDEREWPKEVVFRNLAQLGDPPGASTVRDRLREEALDRFNLHRDRIAAAQALDVLGFGDDARGLIDLHRAGLTYSRLLVLRRAMQVLAEEESRETATQEDVDALLEDVVVAGTPKDDHWGRALRAQLTGAGDFHLLSDGPDSVAGTPDDLSTAESYRDYERRVFASIL